MVSRSEYQSPGRLFIKRFPPPVQKAEISGYLDRYAQFLREESGVGHDPPIDLGKIHRHFGINYSEAPLEPGTDGASSEVIGWIGVNSQVRAQTRRRFTVAHELVELLVAVLQELPIEDSLWFRLKGAEKEALCNSGAASLLIPPESLPVNGQYPGFSVTSIRSLTQRYGASFLATAISVVRHSLDRAALVAWKNGLKPSEEKRRARGAQLSLGDGFEVEPEPKLRIKWTIRSRAADVPYPPPHKSAPPDSVILRCLEEQRDYLGSKLIFSELNTGPDCTIDAVCQHPDSNFEVLTLLRWPPAPSNLDTLGEQFRRSGDRSQ